MSKKSDIPSRARHILVYDEDWEILDKLFGDKSPSKMGVSAACRAILHKRCKELRAKWESKMDEREEEARARMEEQRNG